MKFSQANAKLENLYKVEGIRPYLKGRKVYSFDLLSGWSCPMAKDCLAKVRQVNGRKVLHDGPDTKFRCFSASQEVVYNNVYNSRKYNFDLMKKLVRSYDEWYIRDYINDHLPDKLGVCRIHVAGDFFHSSYFNAWAWVAKLNPERLFYAYTKSLPYWLNIRRKIPYNFVLTASYGGRCDDLISRRRLRYAKVILHPSQTSLDIDHDDSHAADPTKRNQSFALLIHGVQPAGSEASQALRVLRSEGVRHAYSRKS